MRELYQQGGPSVDFFDVREAVGAGNPCDGDIAFYLRQARRTGGPVLDLGCGTGRVALPLSEAGFKVVGLDSSPFMLRIARQKAAAISATIRFVRGNMARFSLNQRFRLVVIPYRAFQHLLTASQQRSCLASVHHHLMRGGRLIVHLFDPRLEFCYPGGQGPPNIRPGCRDPRSGESVDVVISDRQVDPLTQTFSEQWLWSVRDRSGAVVRQSADLVRLRWTYRYEMQYLFELTGFVVRACYSDFVGSRPRYAAEQVWVVEKR